MKGWASVRSGGRRSLILLSGNFKESKIFYAIVCRANLVLWLWLMCNE